MGMLPRSSLMFSRTEAFTGADSTVSGKEASFTSIVHLVADGEDGVVLPCGGVGAASARRRRHHHAGVALGDDVRARRVARGMQGPAAAGGAKALADAVHKAGGCFQVPHQARRTVCAGLSHSCGAGVRANARPG
jgi:hypothetical protein